MGDFINLVKAQKDKKLVSASAAVDLTADATSTEAECEAGRETNSRPVLSCEHPPLGADSGLRETSDHHSGMKALCFCRTITTPAGQSGCGKNVWNDR